eukprot:3689874-Prymnesium_polylepis.1
MLGIDWNRRQWPMAYGAPGQGNNVWLTNPRSHKPRPPPPIDTVRIAMHACVRDCASRFGQARARKRAPPPTKSRTPQPQDFSRVSIVDVSCSTSCKRGVHARHRRSRSSSFCRGACFVSDELTT